MGLQDRPVGFCISSITGGEGEIESLYVLEDHRGESIGRRLMERAVSWCKSSGADAYQVSVAVGNEKAHAFLPEIRIVPPDDGAGFEAGLKRDIFSGPNSSKR
jgi:ribosomal protein S18 acetylase RimI-like enzyme